MSNKTNKNVAIGDKYFMNLDFNNAIQEYIKELFSVDNDGKREMNTISNPENNQSFSERVYILNRVTIVFNSIRETGGYIELDFGESLIFERLLDFLTAYNSSTIMKYDDHIRFFIKRNIESKSEYLRSRIFDFKIKYERLLKIKQFDE